ncbi:MAG TPA: autotransporter-associated beta strand repeat-containing protein [bacterium]|nr:autotransporter-associated beta strand repeat-containing protein [bacterium]
MKTMIQTKPLAVTRPAWRFHVLCLAAAFAWSGANASAQLISSESFAGYTTGTMLPNNVPSPSIAGYSGNWTNVDFGTAWPQTISGSLSYGGAGYAAGSADHIGVLNNTVSGEINAANSGRIYRLLDSSLAVTGSTTGVRYLSWLFQSGQETGATTYQMLELFNGDTADAHRTFTAGLTQNGGNSGSEYDFGVNEAYTSTGVAADTAVHLFVVKLDLNATAGSDNVTVWIDPTLGAGEPSGGFTVSGQDIVFDRLAISDYDGNSANWDEIRWGTTFDSVTITAPPVAPTVAAVVNPATGSANQTFTITATITPGSGTVTNVSVDLSPIGGSATASLVLSNASVYTNTFTVSSSASVGGKTLTVSAKDTTPLVGTYALTYTVLSTSRVWDGGSLIDSKWSSVTNWVGDVAPAFPTESVTFAGTTRLTPDMDTNYSITGLTFDSTAGSFVVGTSTGSTLTNGSVGIVNNSVNAQTLNVPIVMGAAQVFNTAAGNLTLGSNVTGVVALTKTGTNTLTFSGSGTSTIGDMIVTNGLLKVTAGTVRVSATQGNSKIDMGGSVEVATGGTLQITNGVNSWFPVGDTADSMTNTLTISGGAFILNDNWGMEVPRQGIGILNLNSGSVTVNDIGGVGLIIGDMATAQSGTVNLNGGTLTANKITSANGANVLYFNGGTLSPTVSRTDWLVDAGSLTVEVRNNGAFVDTAGFTVTIGELLQHSSVAGDNATDGGLTKLGTGTLTMAGGYNYTGPTRVLGGVLNYNTALGSSGGDVVVSNAVLQLDASSGSALAAANVAVQSGGVLNLTNNPSVAAISGTGNLTLSGGTTITLNYGTLGANPTAAAINVAGSFTASGTNVINVVANGTMTVGSFPLIDYTGTAVPTNTFVLGTLPAGVTAVLTNNADNTSLDLLITLIGNSLSWHGANSDNSLLLTNWDINTSANWYDASITPSVYMQYSGNTIGDKVTFGDYGYNLDGTNAVNLSGRVVPATVTAENNSYPYALTGAGGIDGSTGFTKNGGNWFLLGTSNNYSGGTIVNAGTLAVNNSSALGSGSVTLAGGTLQFAANVTNANSVTVTANSTLEAPVGVAAQMSGSVTGAVNLAQIGGGALTLVGNVTVAGLTKSDNGTLTLMGSNTFNGNVTLNAGTVNVAGGTMIPGGGNPNLLIGSAGAKAMLQVSGTASLISPNTGKFVRLGTLGGIGIISNGPNALLSFNTFGIGFGNNGASSAGAIYNAGTFTNLSGSYLGNADNSYGYFQNSGTAYFNDNIHIAHNDVTTVNGAIAVLDVTGGNVLKASAGTFWLNDQNRTYSGTGASAGLNITGGTLTFLASAAQWNINNGVNNYASVNVTGSGLIAMTGDAGFGLGRNNSAANRETFTLANGGTFQGSYVFTGAALSQPVFTFNNGTYRASGANTTGLIQSGNLAYIQSGGATFDTAGFNCKVPAALLAPTGNGVTSIILGGTTTGYIGAPVVKIVGDGVGAAAIANFDPATGTITGITVTSPGSGYTTATVTLEGGSGTPGNGATAGGATATAQLGAVTSGGLTKTGNGTLSLNGVNTYTGPTVVSVGTLGGNGTIAGVLTNNATLAPGNGGIGTLTINGNLTLNAGSTNLFEVNGTTLAKDVIVAGGAIKYGGVLQIAPAGTFTNGQQFVLFSGAGATNAGNFASLQGSPGSGLGFTFTNGVLSVVTTGPSGPASIANSYSGGTLSLSWPAGQGWRLQMQTNSLSAGLGTNWIYLTDGSISSTNITVDPAKPAAFYRLMYP